MTSRRRRPHYRPATVGYRASRWKARLPRQTGLTGVHLRSVLRFASGFHPTRPHGKGLGCAMPASVSCSCLRLLVASNRPHKGLSPSVIHPCPTHLPPRPRPRLQPHTRSWGTPLVPKPSYHLVQEIQPGHMPRRRGVPNMLPYPLHIGKNRRGRIDQHHVRQL